MTTTNPDLVDRLRGSDRVEAMNRQFWLAKVDKYGNPTLVDGAHGKRSGVEKALYLFNRLHLSKGETYACAEVIITPVGARPHGANNDAIETLNRGRQP